MYSSMFCSVHSLEERLRHSESRTHMSDEQYIAEKHKTGQQADFIKRLQRKLLLVTKVRCMYYEQNSLDILEISFDIHIDIKFNLKIYNEYFLLKN